MRWGCRWRSRERARTDHTSAVVAYFGDGASSQGDVNESFIWASVFDAPVVFFCQNNQWAISRAAGEADPDPAVPPGARVRLPRGPGRRQRRARGACGDPAAPAGRPRGRRADADRGVHLPDGRAHHLGRSDPLPARRAISRPGSSRTRSSGCGRSCGRASSWTRSSSTTSTTESEALAVRLREGCRALPDPDPWRSSTTSTPSRTPLRRLPSGGSSPTTWRPSRPAAGRRSRWRETLTMAKALNAGLRALPRGRRPRPLIMGEDVGQARRGLPGHRRAAEGLRRATRDRHPAGRERHPRHRDRTGHARASDRSSRSSSTASSSPPTTRSSASWPRCTPGPRVRCRMPVVVRIPYGGGIGAVEHHSESPGGVLRAHRRAAGGDALPHPWTPTGCSGRRSPATTR